ncbi:uncharacterized protein NPIL_614621 [Nephila pilipes]|uniref:Uncharacterized protein n=1 Tax=Nephila pilipes TaxID=299642 RepID=A0A8X6MZH6_NEPPI|nr:uncharacterized protein NPIL_614621 [Nephila pilipes]
MLTDKLEAFDNLRRSLPSGPKRHVKASETLNVGRQVSSSIPKREYSHEVPIERSSLKCYGSQTRSPRLTLIDITFCGKKGRVCADTGSSYSIAGEKMYQVFKDKGLISQETTLAMSLADGQQTTGKRKSNSSAGLILDVKNACWYFWDNPTHKYPFGEELDTPSIAEKMSGNNCQLREGKEYVFAAESPQRTNHFISSDKRIGNGSPQ